MVMGFYWCWYLLQFCFILIAISINCEAVDQTTKTTETGKVCNGDQSNTIEVISRTSTMFTCHISYSCYINSSATLAVFKNDNISTECKVNHMGSHSMEKTVVAITCENIMNNAGRTWTFVFGNKHEYDQTIAKQTFTVTLEPLPLKDLPSFDIILNEELTSASILVPHCDQVAEKKYLSFQCRMDDNENRSLSDDCTFTCPVKSGLVYNISVVRFPIPRHNGAEKVDDTFSADRRVEHIRIGSACNNNHSNAIKVVKRTSNMFTCNISYDCLITNSAKLAVFKNDNIATQCKVNLTYFPVIEKTNVIITCDNIVNNGGQNWKFVFGSTNGHNSGVVNETFVVTLEPVPLKDIPSFNVTIDENITSASILVPHCDQIAEKKYLTFQCRMDDNENRSVSEDCIFTCPVKPGTVHNIAIIRIPIPKHDGTDNVNGTFPMERKPQIFHTKPDKARNFKVELNKTNTTVAFIYFTRPRDYFDYIHIECFAYHQYCTNSSYYLTGNVYKTCTNCTHITITPIVSGVEYKCWANISKASVSSIQYKTVDFYTGLQPVLYQQTWLPNKTDIIINVLPQSDFSNVESVCKANDTQKPVCTDMKTIHNQCVTTLRLTFNGNRGCNYRCFFSTKKEGFADANSTEFFMSIPPPKPKIISSKWGSRYILVHWTIDEPTYVDSFSVIVNGKSVLISDRRTRSFNYTNNILPNRQYGLQVALNSNQRILSDTIYNQTAEDGFRSKQGPSLMWLIIIPILVILLIIGLIVWKRKAIQRYCSTGHQSRSDTVHAELIEWEEREQ